MERARLKRTHGCVSVVDGQRGRNAKLFGNNISSPGVQDAIRRVTGQVKGPVQLGLSLALPPSIFYMLLYPHFEIGLFSLCHCILHIYND